MKSGVIPNDVRFSDRVLVLPRIYFEFSRPISWATTALSSLTTDHKCHYEWVERGEAIKSINIMNDGFLTSRMYTAPLLSPVFGVLLTTGGFFADFDSALFNLPWGNVAILLPEGVSAPQNAEDYFREFCQFCYEHGEIFTSHKNDAWKPTETELSAMIEKQKRAPIKVMSATQEYSWPLQGLKNAKPELVSRLP